MTQVQSSRPSQYDPNQDPEEAAKLQQSLRAYNRRALDMEQSTSDSSSVSTLEAAQQVRQFLDELDLSNPDSVSSRIHQPAEAIMEAEAICAVVRSSRAISRNLPTGLTRRLTEGDFLAKVVTFMSPQGSFHVNAAGGGDDDDDDDVPSQQSNANTLDWTRLGSAAAPVFRRVPAMRVLHGPLSIIPPVRKVINRARASRDPDEKPHTTKVVDSTSLVKSEETDIRSRELLAILRGLEEVNVFKFVLNPASFSQSVENLFYLAFLVRDGHVEVFFDEATSMPMVGT
ncbi:hypothetical protein CAOG_01122 [Capsaspora owczarzaki ATCC 30864]|uniref:hypothetical protein n=1 Tax=Capsaspora owczarzaki (strain ATCC 30864) TaxID=595528 RepID=UPI0001FE258C|nr:hypothetical protein CAOG_01122 [Capsaspora owczarzaki ATCC 30864]|eukprot:XP_004365993.1 hypothetical protein CAOG_01122 [Capsaspora owczarzaki ATCC 30864]